MASNSYTESERQLLLDTVQLLAVLFRGPDAQACENMLLRGVPLLAEDSSGFSPIAKPLAGLAGALPAPDQSDDFCDRLESDYVKFFVSNPQGVSAPLYESCHLGSERKVMGPSTLAMQTRLAEAGLEPALPGNEPEDHLCIELEYLYFLLSSSTSSGQGSEFASAIMLPWCSAFADTVIKVDPDGVYGHGARLLVAVLKAI